MKKQISINKDVLKKYSDEQLKAWARDNDLDAADLAEVKRSLKSKEAVSSKPPMEGDEQSS